MIRFSPRDRWLSVRLCALSVRSLALTIIIGHTEHVVHQRDCHSTALIDRNEVGIHARFHGGHHGTFVGGRGETGDVSLGAEMRTSASSTEHNRVIALGNAEQECRSKALCQRLLARRSLTDQTESHLQFTSHLLNVRSQIHGPSSVFSGMLNAAGGFAANTTLQSIS